MGASLNINFDSDNQAFADYPCQEAVSILKKITAQIENAGDSSVDGTIHDSNGNRVGDWDFTVDHDEDLDDEDLDDEDLDDEDLDDEE